MSEPTGDGNQQQNPEQATPGEPEADPGEIRDQASGSDFNDPTAPVWADPTAPIPAPPAAPPPPPTAPGAANPYGQPAAAPQATPPAAPPMSNPYAQPPPAQPYGQPTDQYGQPQYGQQYPAYGQSPYATGAAPSNTSAIILTILSVLSLCNVVAIGSLVLGIMALTKTSTDPEGSRRSAKIGWIVFAVGWTVVIGGFVGLVALGIATDNNGTYNFNSGY